MSLQNVSLYEGMVCLWDRKRNGSTITGKYSCRKISMLSRHFRAHNLNVPEMRLLFSLRCADPGIFVRGGEGGGPTAEKQPQQHYF